MDTDYTRNSKNEGMVTLDLDEQYTKTNSFVRIVDYSTRIVTVKKN